MRSKRNCVIRLACFLTFIPVFTSCLEKQECEAPTTYTIEGHLFKDCNKEPVSGFEIHLYRDDYNGRFAGKNEASIVETVITDSLGYFKFSYQGLGGTDMHIRHIAGYGFNYLLESIPLGISYKDLDVYFNPMINIEYYLDVKNEYSEFDTLQFHNFTAQGYKVAGPFKSGFLIRLDSLRLFNMSFARNNYGITHRMLPWNGIKGSTFITIENYCDNVIPVTLTIE